MELCEANRAIAKEIKNFIKNVPQVKEESITDYLVWKWSLLDKRFRYVNITTFTRQEESLRTGADFELELWLIGNAYCLPLLFQAKKFVKPFDSYVNKLNYPKGTQGQLSKLLSYAKAKNRLPFYIYYSFADSNTRVNCIRNNTDYPTAGGNCAENAKVDTGLFISDAFTVKEFADRTHGIRVSKNAILEKSSPFHCIFCCSLYDIEGYLYNKYKKLYVEIGISQNIYSSLPDYVSYMLNGGTNQIDKHSLLLMINQYELELYRNVAVYDLRDFNDKTQ